MPSTLTHTTALVVTTCWCGMPHAVPKELFENMSRQHRDGRQQTGIYCPLGHRWTFGGKGEAEIERERRERAERTAANLAEEVRIAQAETATVKKAAHRAAQRTKGGACPCCNRSFVQLARHIKTQHPTFAAVK